MTRGDLLQILQEDAEIYAGCVGGAIDIDDYLSIIREAGFENITLQKKKPFNLPDVVLKKYMGKEKTDKFRRSNKGIFSVTVSGEKPK